MDRIQLKRKYMEREEEEKGGEAVCQHYRKL
jgi:hypothetical protein